MGPCGKTVEDVACLLDVLISDRGFQSGLANAPTRLAIGVSNERVSEITVEEEALFSEAQACLGPMIVARDLRVRLHKKTKEDGCADVLINHMWKDA
jgi:hypothetical protein